MRTYEECVKAGLLRRVPASKAQAASSVRAASRWLEEAERSLQHSMPNTTLLIAYLVMFHAARSLLFSDGYRERSHYCNARYIEAQYKGRIDERWVVLLDHYRDLRHISQYDTSPVTTMQEAEEAVANAKAFLSQIEKISAL